jgi:translation initiation factor 1
MTVIVRFSAPGSQGPLVLGPSVDALRYRRADAQARGQPGRVVEHRRRPAQGPKLKARIAAGGRVKVRRETSGRRGKAVTTVADVPLDDAGLKELAGRLKKRCGVGGAVKDGVIELQGDHRDAVVEVLRADGYDAVLAGG